jgi:hypothetical protein
MKRDFVLVKDSEERDPADEHTGVDCPRELPRIDVTDERVPTVAAEAWAVMRTATDSCGRALFVRVGDMACVRTEKGLEAFTRATLGYWLARFAEFFRSQKNGEKVVRPPAWLISDMLAEPMPDLPEEQQQ